VGKRAVTCGFLPKIEAEDGANYVDDELIADYGEEHFSDQQCFVVASSLPKVSPALTSRARPCPRACKLGRATRRETNSPALTSGPARARACTLGRVEKRAMAWGFLPKIEAEDGASYGDDERIADYGEEQISDQQYFVVTPSVPKGSPALTSRARPCPRACILGRATIWPE
jgi:hypothetical protein